VPDPALDLAIASTDLRVVVAPSLGGRVVSLTDRRTGREWLVAGERPDPPDAWAGEDVAFLGRESWGWDECLPTVSRCADPSRPGAPSLRDHGDVWGRALEVGLTDGRLVVELPPARWPYRFRRSLAIDGPSVTVGYDLANERADPLPFLWSMHPVLALEPGSRLIAPGVTGVRLTHAAGTGLGVPAEVDWPIARRPDGSGLDLAEIRGIEAGEALKLYGRVDGGSGRSAALAPDGSWVAFTWDAGFAPVLGLWVDAGGWPPDDPRAQVAIEPTTSEDDDLVGALAHGRAVMLAPGERRRWWVRIDVGPPADGDRLAALLG
jgi:galactose mutarotase-like enzyme